jgi:hypothetical protein
VSHTPPRSTARRFKAAQQKCALLDYAVFGTRRPIRNESDPQGREFFPLLERPATCKIEALFGPLFRPNSGPKKAVPMLTGEDKADRVQQIMPMPSSASFAAIGSTISARWCGPI